MSITPRFALPLLHAGQAQKEMFHNEAVAGIDALLHPDVRDVGIDAPPVAPEPGDAWIVGADPIGDWAGHGDALASWTEGGGVSLRRARAWKCGQKALGRRYGIALARGGRSAWSPPGESRSAGSR